MTNEEKIRAILDKHPTEFYLGDKNSEMNVTGGVELWSVSEQRLLITGLDNILDYLEAYCDMGGANEWGEE